MSRIKEARSKILGWRENPVKFVYDNFKVEPDEWQKDALMACGGPPNPRRRLGMKACTGPGKSTVLAWIALHRLSCFGERGRHPKGAALSGEGRDNLRDNLWAEISKWRERSEFLKSAFGMTQSQLFANDHMDTWFLSARSYAKDADNEAVGRSLSGLHSEFPFILLDECGDMPPTIGQKASQIFTGGVVDGLIAAAGNPTSTTGLLYLLSTQERHLWNVITITADPDDPKRTPRVSVAHAKEQIALHGKDNPWVMSTILGLFPPQGFNNLLSLAEVEAAVSCRLREDAYSFSQKRIGVDVARFGDDRTILAPRQGLRLFKLAEMRNARNPEIAARVALAKQRFGSEMEFIDATGGYGGGVIDCLLQSGYSPFGVEAAGKAMDSRYYNKRAEIWFAMADWVKRGAWIPNDPQLVKEMVSPRYSFKDGKLILEPKDQIKKRLGFSPDKADAVCQTFALPEMPSATSNEAIIARHSQQSAKEYDPFHDA